MEADSPALSAFIASYKRRRLGAKLAWGLFAAAALIWYSYGRLHRRHYDDRSIELEWKLAWACLAAAVPAAATWLFARCPECGRYIGTSLRRRADFTSRPPCELEQACAGEFSDVDG